MEAETAFVARMTVEDGNGLSKVAWVPLAAATPAEAQVEFRKLQTQRAENTLGQIGRTPKFGDYLDKTYLPLLPSSGKKLDRGLASTMAGGGSREDNQRADARGKEA